MSDMSDDQIKDQIKALQDELEQRKQQKLTAAHERFRRVVEEIGDIELEAALNYALNQEIHSHHTPQNRIRRSRPLDDLLASSENTPRVNPWQKTPRRHTSADQ